VPIPERSLQKEDAMNNNDEKKGGCRYAIAFMFLYLFGGTLLYMVCCS